MKISIVRMGAAFSFALLAACGGGESAEKPDAAAASSGDGATSVDAAAAATIEARQAGLKRMGRNVKAIGDELKGGAPDQATLAAAAAVIVETANAMGDWFPDGTSAAAGVETDALDAIWAEPEKFSEAIGRLKSTSADLATAVESGDAAAISAAFDATRGACKNCHDSFRKDDD